MNHHSNNPAPPIIFVVPCYNEEDRLDLVQFVDYAQANSDIGLWFVNDGSTDGTLDRLHEISRQSPQNTEVIDLPKNCGKAEAVRRGLLKALEANPQAVGFLDADLATPLEEIDRFCDILHRYPDVRLVVGSRIPLMGHQIRRRKKRALCGRAFAFAASVSLRNSIYDTQCGAKLFRNEVEVANSLRRPFISRWIFDVEILARIQQFYRFTNIAQLDRVVFELPLERWREVEGSKLKTSDFARAALELINICRKYVLVRKPTYWQEVLGIPTSPRLQRRETQDRESIESPMIVNDRKAA